MGYNRPVFLRKPLFWFVSVILCLSAQGQTKSTSRKAPPSNVSAQWKLVSLDVKGSQRYTPDEILGETRLQIGQSVNEDNFKKATELLGQTGIFSDVSYAYTYSSEGAKLELQLSDNNELVPARFDNFVWLPDKDLLDKLRERVPLFKGLLPTGGDLADEVSDALQALLIEHKVQGKADYIRVAPTNGPVSAFLFTVSGHSVQVQNVTFTDVGPAELPLLQTAAKRLLNSEYTHTTIKNEERIGFQPIYLQRGYLKASFDETQVKIVKDGEDETSVDVTIAVTPGLQYKLTDMGWTGNTVFPSPEPQGLIRLKSGEREESAATLAEAITKLMSQARSGLEVKRFKGLGEMNPEQLWHTTLDTNARSLLQVKVKEVDEADDIFTKLMGDVVEPRREFIQDNSLSANVDV